MLSLTTYRRPAANLVDWIDSFLGETVPARAIEASWAPAWTSSKRRMPTAFMPICRA